MANPTVDGVVKVYRTQFRKWLAQPLLLRDLGDVDQSPTDNQVLTYNAAGDNFDWGVVAGGGEINTASNVGVSGIGFFARKTGVDLEFKNLNLGTTGGLTSKLSLTDDTVNNEVDIDLADINLNDLSDVNAPSPSDNQALAWDSGTSRWINQTVLIAFDTLDNDYGIETITSLFTFDRDPSPPFAVTAGSAVVTNLDADLLDGLNSTAFAQVLTSAGGTESLINDSSTPSWALKGLTAGTNITLTPSATDITIAATGGVTDHGALTGLGDDDHTQYLLASGGRALTGNWDAGNFNITCGTIRINENATAEIQCTSWISIGTANMIMQRSKGAEPTHTALVDGDAVGNFQWEASDGVSAFRSIARVRATATGTITATSAPGLLSLQTTPVGGLTPVGRLDIDETGFVDIVDRCQALRFTSDIGSGTAPYSCTSTTVNPNLNADLVDGLHSSSLAQILASAGGTNSLVVDATTPGWTLRGLNPGANLTISNVAGTAYQIAVSPQGSGSSLDADLLDALHATSFAQTLSSAGGANSLINDATTPSWALKGFTGITGINITNTSTVVTVAMSENLTRSVQYSADVIEDSTLAVTITGAYHGQELRVQGGSGTPTYFIRFGHKFQTNKQGTGWAVTIVFFPESVQSGIKDIRWGIGFSTNRSGETTGTAEFQEFFVRSLDSGHPVRRLKEETFTMAGLADADDIMNLRIFIDDHASTTVVGDVHLLTPALIEYDLSSVAHTGAVS